MCSIPCTWPLSKWETAKRQLKINIPDKPCWQFQNNSLEWKPFCFPNEFGFVCMWLLVQFFIKRKIPKAPSEVTKLSFVSGHYWYSQELNAVAFLGPRYRTVKEADSHLSAKPCFHGPRNLQQRSSIFWYSIVDFFKASTPSWPEGSSSVLKP